jgi:hypothetical protein
MVASSVDQYSFQGVTSKSKAIMEAEANQQREKLKSVNFVIGNGDKGMSGLQSSTHAGMLSLE